MFHFLWKYHYICWYGSFAILCKLVYTLLGTVADESYIHMFQLNEMESLKHCWKERSTWEGPRTQPYLGQTELLTDFLENYLVARKNISPERLQHAQQRWKELSTEVAVISQLKKQTRQSQLIRAIVSNIVMKLFHVIFTIL